MKMNLCGDKLTDNPRFLGKWEVGSPPNPTWQITIMLVEGTGIKKIIIVSSSLICCFFSSPDLAPRLQNLAMFIGVGAYEKAGHMPCFPQAKGKSHAAGCTSPHDATDRLPTLTSPWPRRGMPNEALFPSKEVLVFYQDFEPVA